MSFLNNPTRHLRAALAFTVTADRVRAREIGPAGLGQIASPHKPPGSRARGILDFVFNDKTNERIFNQIIADMRAEHAEAIARGHLRKARWIEIRGHVCLILTAVQHVAGQLAFLRGRANHR